MDTIFIAKRIKVGYKKVSDKVISYPIYWDEVNVIRKEDSWNKWRDKSLGESEYSNELCSGFKLVEFRNSYSFRFGYRDSHVLLSHPLGFIFEITISNFYELVMVDGVQNGTINGSQVLSWEKGELYLLSKRSELYAEACRFTERLYNNEPAKIVMQPGRVYKMRNGSRFLYLGVEDVYVKDKTEKSFYSKLSYKPNTFTKRKMHLRVWVTKNGKVIQSVDKCASKPKVVEEIGFNDEWKVIRDIELNYRNTLGDSLIDPFEESVVYHDEKSLAEMIKMYINEYCNNSHKSIGNVILFDKFGSFSIHYIGAFTDENYKKFINGEEVEQSGILFGTKHFSLKRIVDDHQPFYVEHYGLVSKKHLSTLYGNYYIIHHDREDIFKKNYKDCALYV